MTHKIATSGGTARTVVLGTAVMAGLALAVAIGSLSARLIDQLERNRHAPRDNVHWSIQQIHSEIITLQLELGRLRGGVPETLNAFRTRYDIFYSRVSLLETAPLFDALRGHAFFRDGLKKLRTLLEDFTPIVDGGDAALIAAAEHMNARLADHTEQLRPFILQSIVHFAKISDRERRELSNLLYSLGLLVVVLVIILVCAVLSLLRHAAKLERRERALIESESRMAATVSSALDAVIVADSRGTVLEFNAQASECFGYARQDAIGRNLAELIIPEPMRAAHAAGMRRFRETGIAKIIGTRIEIDALHANGHVFPVELAVGSATNSGETIFVAYARDITQRRQDERELREAREKAEAADHAKSRFLAVMSHEMRTPLNGITGVLQLLRDSTLDPDQCKLVDTAERSGEALLDLINDVLDISKMEAGKLDLTSADFDLRDTVRRVEDILRVEAVARGNTIVVTLDERLPQRLVGDDKRLRQVLLNLASNANKFTENGVITLGAACVVSPDGNELVRLSVTDTGVGIPHDKIETLFNEFTSLDNSYNRRRGGTGLGLSICRHLVGLMGSEIRVESTPGLGSRFWFDIAFPAAVTAARREAHDAHQPQRPDGQRALRGSVLLAEDNPTNAMVATSILTRAGLEVTHAADGRQAVTAARSGAFDLILMDVSMPALDGMQATGLIRQLGGSAGRVPIVAMTAHALSGDREKFLSAGMDDYITKPIRKQVLLQAVERNLRSPATGPATGKTISGIPSSAEPAAAAFDQETLAILAAEIQHGMLPILMEQFATETKTRVKQIESGFVAGDFKAIRQAAHALKGSSATLGATGLARCAGDLEIAAEQQDGAAIETMMDAFLSAQVLALKAAAAHRAGNVDSSRADRANERVTS